MKAWLFSILIAFVIYTLAANAEDSAPAEAKAAYRTDSANQQLAWYRLKPGEFPPIHSEHRVSGDLVAADFIHRSGQFRADDGGELKNFTLLPYAVVSYLDAEADLRDVPLGTHLAFFLYQDEKGAFTKTAAIQDDYTLTARQGLIYRLDNARVGQEKNGAGKLDVTRQKPGENAADANRQELVIDDRTLIWKDAERIKAADLTGGDELLANFTQDKPGGAARCMEIWVGASTRKLATERQRKTHTAFLKKRGLAAQIDRSEGKELVVTFFGDPTGLAALFKDEGIVPEQWAREHRQVRAVVANEELRTYNPPVDGEGSEVLESINVPTDRYGCSGVQWTIRPNLLLEGFRKGHIIRIFAHQSWPVEDMAFGEGLYTERFGAKVEEELANQYSYRTDFANERLPWYQLKAGEFPPYQSQHTISGELLKADAIHRSGQFRTDGTGEVVDFTMPPYGFITYLNAGAELVDLPVGRHYFFSLYQDEKGAFTKAVVIIDDFTRLASDTVSNRVEAIKLEEGKIILADQLAKLLDDKDHLIRPPDLGRAEFGIDDTARVWKGDKELKAADLAVGDDLLVNLSGCTATRSSRCIDIWDGLDTQKLATEKRHADHDAFLKRNGLPAWIESVDGKTLTVTFFAGNRRNFQDIMNGEPGTVSAKLVDEDLRPIDDRVETLRFKDHLPERNTAGTYGAAGVRWILEAERLPEQYRQGRIIRVSRPEWQGNTH